MKVCYECWFVMGVGYYEYRFDIDAYVIWVHVCYECEYNMSVGLLLIWMWYGYGCKCDMNTYAI